MLRRKLPTLFLCASLLLCNLPFSSSAFASPSNATTMDIQNITLTETDKASIQRTINDFFNIEKESLVNGNLIDSNKITANEKLRKSYNSKNEFNILWNKKLNEKITSYNFNVKYDSFELKDNKCTVDLTRDRTMTSTNFPNIDQQSAGEKFSFVLEKEDSNWYIDSYANSEDDGFDKEEVSLKSNKLEVTNERLAKWEQNLQNIDELVSDFKNITLNKDKDKDSSSMKPAQYSGYNGIAASEYAQTWAMSYNPYYQHFDGNGGDCTNFASQAIHAGGLPYGLSWQPYTNAWIRVITLRDYLVINNYGTEFPYVPFDYIGQLIQFSDASGWGHSGILTYYSSNGDYLYCCHSDFKKNWPLSSVFPGRYSQIRVFRIYS
ncbi:amidase domain-containing protein [Clostridium kluyveri]|uniref:amidase domain-containing protein n=1 Tax=Clostridium kluyveri TaxID=1534 RepID=UPI0022450644|nr:amidase domain-containing protein [Clostridium kluyveri]UZQ52305.1 amidase domain-containing protein [Clostridium kluyveri]